MATATIRKAATGELFLAPCLNDIEGEELLGRKISERRDRVDF